MIKLASSALHSLSITTLVVNLSLNISCREGIWSLIVDKVFAM